MRTAAVWGETLASEGRPGSDSPRTAQGVAGLLAPSRMSSPLPHTETKSPLHWAQLPQLRAPPRDQQLGVQCALPLKTEVGP